MALTPTTLSLKWWEQIIYGIVYGLVYAFSLLPLRVLYVFSNFFYFVIYRVAKYRVKLVRKNLADSFPEKSESELRDIERRFYRFIGDYIVETIKLISISKRNLRRRVTYSNIELINDNERKGRSVSLYIGHYCNWEWITGLGLQLLPTSFAGQVYHVLENRIFDKLFLKIRQRMGSVCVPMAEILRRRVECRQNNRAMVMGYIADQTPFWNNIHYWTDFLNHDTPVLTGSERITKRFNDVAVYLDIKRVRRGYYSAEVVPLAVDDTRDIPDWEITEAYFRALERTIRRQPEFWLWTHNRWKRTREEYNRRIDPATGKFKF